jgi:uncharacterized protein
MSRTADYQFSMQNHTGTDSYLAFLYEFASRLNRNEQAALSRLVPSSTRSQLFGRFRLELSEFDFGVPSAEKQLAMEIKNRNPQLGMVSSGQPRELYAIMKPTRLCNLRCGYCNAWREGPGNKMSFEVLAEATIQVLDLADVSNVHFVWHGGEPTLVPRSFYMKALWLQAFFNPRGITISNALQTNGTMLTEDWVDFFEAHHFSIGVSLDGPREVQDRQRVDVSGHGTFDCIVAGIRKLSSRKVPFGILLVVSNETVALGAESLLHSLIEMNVKQVAFLNSLPPNDKPLPVSDSNLNYLRFEKYVMFLMEIYEVWNKSYRDRIQIRELASLEASIAGNRPKLCVHRGRCMGEFLTIDPNGAVSACDKYVGDSDYEFGNLLHRPLPDLLRNSSRLANAIVVANGQSDIFEEQCPYGDICRGGCPHDAYVGEKRKDKEKEPCCGLAPLIGKMMEQRKSAN